MPSKPLEGIRIIDLTRIYAGPYCSMLFADMGAEVIKIEPPEGEMIRDNPPMVKQGEGGPHDRSRSGYFLALNRNKYGITLNLKHPRAVRILKDLVKIGGVNILFHNDGVRSHFGRILRSDQPNLAGMARIELLDRDHIKQPATSCIMGPDSLNPWYPKGL